MTVPVINGFPIFDEQYVTENWKIEKETERLFGEEKDYDAFLEQKRNKLVYDLYAAFQPFNESTQCIFPLIPLLRELLRPGDLVPVDCQAIIVNENGEVVKSGETGELLLRGASITSGYLGESITTRSVQGAEWFATGDLAYCDDESVFWLVGRKKNIIIVGGRNVYPDEVNNVLISHSSVMEAATIGMPDDLWGERVVGCVISNGNVTSAELIEYASKQLADYKVPREIHLFKEFPKGRSGKILVNQLLKVVQEGKGIGAEASQTGIEEQIVQLASQSFRTPASELSMKTAPANCSNETLLHTWI